MNHRSSGVSLQSKNRGLVPQKLRHFFASFPESYEIPALPDWLLRRPMGSVWCVPKSPQLNHPSGGGDHQLHPRQKGRRNRIEPESNAQFLPKRRYSKKANKVANLTYKNTWSSFLKTSQSDQVKFFPVKSIAPPLSAGARPSVRFDQQRRSWDDSALISERQTSVDDTDISPSPPKPKSSSPIRRRPSSMRADSRKYSKIESKALREAWLNENVFPQFSIHYSARAAAAAANATTAVAQRPVSAHKSSKTSYTLHEIVSSCPPVPPYRPPAKHHRRCSIEANVSSGTSNDTYLTPGSMEMSGTSTLPTTSGSIQVNATSSPSSSFDSMQARYSIRPVVCSPPERDRYDHRIPDDSLLETTTSQSVEVQVSSTITSSTSLQPHLSSSSGGYPPELFVNNMSASNVARDVLKRERAISSANSRKSCLKERSRDERNGRGRTKPMASNFKDPSRLEWTKRFLYTAIRIIELQRYCHLTKGLMSPVTRLAPPSTGSYYQHDRSSSMSRVSSGDPRDFQVYPVQRLWQSSPDLRLEKWKPPTSTKNSLDESALDVVDMMRTSKKQFLAHLFQERTNESEPYRSLKNNIKSLALLPSSVLPRSASAGRSRSSDQYSMGYGSEEPPKWTKFSTAGTASSRHSKIKPKPDYKKSQESLSRELELRKKQNLTTTTRPFHFSSDNLARGDKYSTFISSIEPTKQAPFSTPPTPRKTFQLHSRRVQSPDKRPKSSVKFNSLQSFTAPLQPASGENKASVLRRSLTKKKCEEELVHSWRQQQLEREKRNRLRAIRLDPAWSQVRGADQALEDIAHRRCYKEVVERERLLQYYMEREEMLNRVYSMPPLFERQASKIERSVSCGRMNNQPQMQLPDHEVSIDMGPASSSSNGLPNNKSRCAVPAGGTRKKTSFRANSKTEESLDCYLASDSLQLSRPSTAKSSVGHSKRH